MKKKAKSKFLKNFFITLFVFLILNFFTQYNNIFSENINNFLKPIFNAYAINNVTEKSASYDELAKENAELKNQVANLRQKLAEFNSLKNENKKLMEFYDIKEKNSNYKIIPANVIKRDVNDEFYSFTLNCGTKDGVRKNAVVITKNGIAGFVCSVYDSECRVNTILSPQTKISVVDVNTNSSGIVTGSCDLCDKNIVMLTNINDEKNINVGDIIASAGNGGIYPKNLIVGEISEIVYDEYTSHKYALVKPYENIKTITYAAVVIA